MKKRSFFERLAGNLRFNEVDDEMDEQVEDVRPLARKGTVAPRTHEPEPQRRELFISNAFKRENEDEDESPA